MDRLLSDRQIWVVVTGQGEGISSDIMSLVLVMLHFKEVGDKKWGKRHLKCGLDSKREEFSYGVRFVDDHKW